MGARTTDAAGGRIVYHLRPCWPLGNMCTTSAVDRAIRASVEQPGSVALWDAPGEGSGDAQVPESSRARQQTARPLWRPCGRPPSAHRKGVRNDRHERLQCANDTP